MSHNDLFAHPEFAAIAAFAGLAFGLLYFAVLRCSVLLLVDRRGWLGPLALTLGRIAAATLLLFLAARLGAVSLLAAFAGFLMARTIALRARRQAS